MWKAICPVAVFLSLACAAGTNAETPPPRNVILFVGDGMGPTTVTAARIFAGQLAGGTGEEHQLSFERFPRVALVKTYTADFQVAGSAATITAMITGQKTRSGLLSMARGAERGACATALGQELPTLLEQAEKAGYRTGIVTTASLTHATPAAAYAHLTERDWEHDGAMPAGARKQGCRDIARQFIEFDTGDGIDVALGGGRLHFMRQDQADPEYPEQSGARGDGRDLLAEWLAAGSRRTYVWNRAQFDALDPAAPGPVLGLFEPDHMQFEHDRRVAGGLEPSLAQMTGFAIDKLRAGPRGFFLLVEAGRIDHAHHDGNAFRALTDTVMLDAAVGLALQKTDPANTLILVTADHSHPLTFSGYPRRGNPILGKAEPAPGIYETDREGRPYTTLGYMNGPGYLENLPDLSGVDTTAPDYLQVAAYPLGDATHSGEDVAAYAHGVGAEKLGGVIEQNRIYDILYGALFKTGEARKPQP